MPRPTISYANVMSTIAVFVALGGTSYAVARNSIGARELKRDAVTSSKIKNRAVTSSKLGRNAVTSGAIRNGSITSSDLSSSAKSSPRGPRGLQGPDGATGPAGPIGPPGPAALEAWLALPLAAGWTSYGGGWQAGQFRKDQVGHVYLRGMVASGDPPTGSEVMATLPPGYRPPARVMFAVLTGQPTTIPGRLDVLTDGRVLWVSGATGAPNYTHLTGIVFDTD